MGVINRKTGLVKGPTRLIQSVVAFPWKGAQSSRDFAAEINQPVTARLIERHQSWTEGSEAWSHYELEFRAIWDLAAAMLGSAYHQEKIMCTSNAKSIIKRSRGVLMSGYNYFKKCWELRKVASFECVQKLFPPIGIPKPIPISLFACYWDKEINGIALEVEDTMLASFNSVYKKIQSDREKLDRLDRKTKDAMEKRAIEELESRLAQLEAENAQKQGDNTPFKYDEQCGLIWSFFRRGTASDGVISALVELPMGDYIKNPDGSFKLGFGRKPLKKITFTELPANNRQLCPSGFVKLADMSLFDVRFQGETIVARKDTGAIASFHGNLVNILTPEKHTSAAEELLALSRKLNNARCARQRHARIIRRQLTDEKANEKPFVWKSNNPIK